MNKRQRTDDYLVKGYKLTTLKAITNNESESVKNNRIMELDNYLKCFTEYFEFIDSLFELDNIGETYVEKMLKDSNPFLYFIIAFIIHNINIILDNKDYFQKFKPIFEQISNKLNRININWSRDLVELTNYNNTNSKEFLEVARKKIYANFKTQGIHDKYTSFKPSITSQDIIKNTELALMFQELQNYNPNLLLVTIVRGRGKTKRRKRIKESKNKKLKKHITRRLKPRIKTRSKPKKNKNKSKVNKSKKN